MGIASLVSSVGATSRSTMQLPTTNVRGSSHGKSSHFLRMQDVVDAPRPGVFDCPFDNGLYYLTPPLQAEI